MNDADIIQVRTPIYVGRPSPEFCRGRLLHDKIRRSSGRDLSGFAENSRTPFIGFPDSVPFFLTGRGERKSERGRERGKREEREARRIGGKKEVEVHAGVDIDIWFRISGSNQIRSPIAGRQQRLRYNQNEFSTTRDSYDVITVAGISCLKH